MTWSPALEQLHALGWEERLFFTTVGIGIGTGLLGLFAVRWEDERGRHVEVIPAPGGFSFAGRF